MFEALSNPVRRNPHLQAYRNLLSISPQYRQFVEPRTSRQHSRLASENLLIQHKGRRLFVSRQSTTSLHGRRTMSSIPQPPNPETLKPLYNYTACDVSDALLKLKIPTAGFIPDLKLYCPSSETDPKAITIAPASTVLFVPKSGDMYGASGIPHGSHWVDLTTPDTIVVLSQPEGQKNAVCGGIMALRMKVCNAKGIVVGGRVRDIEELKSTGLPIWAKGLSTVGTSAETKAHDLNVPVKLGGTWVIPGDIVFCDPVNGVVVIPRGKLEEVIELIPKIIAADDKVKSDVAKGMLVQEAFKIHRGNL